jgi:DNA-binding protein HU-beta
MEGKLVNKSQLIDTLAARYEGNRKQAAHALEAVIDTITREVAKGEKVAITGFGSFEKRVRDARWVRNPRTGERLKAKKTAVPKFNAGADLKAVVSGAKKLPKLTLNAATTTARAATGTTKAPAKKTSSTAKKATGTTSTAAKKTTAKTAAKKSTATRAPAKKTAAKTTAAKTTAKKATPAKKTTAATKAPAKRATATKAPAQKTTAKTTAKRTSAAGTAPAKKTATRRAAKKS